MAVEADVMTVPDSVSDPGSRRPQDILSDDTIQSDRMAEARIGYDGRGQLTNVQTPRYGQQVVDTLLPF
jgi:flagellar L-ring protein precursor FlgH